MKWMWYRTSRPLEDLSTFDSASRGPWGATQLLWTLRARYACISIASLEHGQLTHHPCRHIVASMGALVFVVSLAVGPVTQLLIRYYDCNIQLPDTSANIPRKNTFSEMGLHLGAGLSTLTYEYQSAINAGLFNPVSVDIAFACPTGNCTFDEVYHSLAYCSKCTDLTASVSRSCGPSTYTVESSNGTDLINTTYTDWKCNTSLPGGFYALADNGPRGVIEYFTMQVADSLYTPGTTVQMIAANLTKPYMTAGQSTGSDNDCTTAAQNATWPCMGYGAASCSLYPCIRSYRATVSQKILKETLLSTSSEFAPDDHLMAAATVDVGCLSPALRQALVDIGYTINETTEWIGYRGPGLFGNATLETEPSAAVPDVTVPAECQYQIYEPTMMSLDYFMASFFNGSVIKDPSSSYDYVTTGPVQLNKFFNAGSVSFENVSVIFSSISDSMTAYIRQSAPASIYTGDNPLDDNHTAPASGQVFQTETCIHVRWGYIAFPITLVVLTFIFLVVMIVETSRYHNGDAFKSSSLALLFHGLDAEARSQYGEMGNVRDMEIAAKQMRVCLRRTDKAWEFTEAR